MVLNYFAKIAKKAQYGKNWPKIFLCLKKIVDIHLIIDTLPSCIAHYTSRGHHGQVKRLICTSNLAECIPPVLHPLGIFRRNGKRLVSELHLTEINSLVATVNNQIYLSTLMLLTVFTYIRLTRP